MRNYTLKKAMSDALCLFQIEKEKAKEDEDSGFSLYERVDY